jgi:hypothetical protein
MPDLYRVQPLLRDGNTRRSRSRQTTLSSAHRPSSTPITGRLVAVRTFLVGIERRKGIPQDGLSPPFVWARPLPASRGHRRHLMNSELMPTFEARGPNIDTALSDN